MKLQKLGIHVQPTCHCSIVRPLSPSPSAVSRWLDQLGIHVPDDIGLACLNLPAASLNAGVMEEPEVIGAAATEMVVAQLQRNEQGPPSHPKLILIEGTWHEGNSIRPLPKAKDTP